MTEADDLAAWAAGAIREFLDNSPENTLGNLAGEKAWDDFLAGFSRGDDSLYPDYKRYVGPYHWTPLEIFSITFPDIPADPAELSVISWILPQREVTKADNRREGTFPAERWLRSRILGERCNKALRAHLESALIRMGFPAVAPMLSPEWARKDSDTYTYASTWSERHAAYAAGLGTFGLSDGLITPKGKAVRVGSVVVKAEIPPTPRPYTDHHAYCLFFTRGICGKCIQRCPVGAITEKGHEKVSCRDYVRGAASEHARTSYNFDGYGCGLCQTAVPCESKIPVPEDVSY
ncbi:MAG: epoxyqueuosine reductase [Thermodesulfobacteriota bacterium]